MILFRAFLLCLSLAGLSFTGCTHHSKTLNDGNVDLDQEVTQSNNQRDTVFLHFAQDWKKYISPSVELHKPVLERPVMNWTPTVIADCRYSTERGHNVPVVELSWNEAMPAQVRAEAFNQTVETKDLRVDISLQYKGFERNYYTTAFPIARNQRFSIPGKSLFVKDTAAVIMAGPAMLPKVVDFQQMKVKVNSQDMVKKILHLTDLGPGAAYRIRLCTLTGENWAPSGEFVFNTPICPLDRK